MIDELKYEIIGLAVIAVELFTLGFVATAGVCLGLKLFGLIG